MARCVCRLLMSSLRLQGSNYLRGPYRRSLCEASKKISVRPPGSCVPRRWMSNLPGSSTTHFDNDAIQHSSMSAKPVNPEQLQTRNHDLEEVRLPRSVQAVYLRPLRREAKYGLPSCDLQLRSYSVRNLEFFADFALRAAYYLNLPASGPIPLPRITERWTVPRSNFVHKKSQENFERITMRRLIQLKDGHPETVGVWLAFLRKHAYYGIGMKAQLWEHEELGVGRAMDGNLANLQHVLEPKWLHFGRQKNVDTSRKVVELLDKDSS